MNIEVIVNAMLILISTATQRKKPLLQAAKRGHVEATLMLLNAHQDCCKQTNDEGQNCLMIAINERHR